MAFELVTDLRQAVGNLTFSHPHCAKFCVRRGELSRRNVKRKRVLANKDVN